MNKDALSFEQIKPYLKISDAIKEEMIRKEIPVKDGVWSCYYLISSQMLACGLTKEYYLELAEDWWKISEQLHKEEIENEVRDIS